MDLNLKQLNTYGDDYDECQKTTINIENVKDLMYTAAAFEDLIIIIVFVY